MTEHGFHEGELAVQQHAGVRDDAARLEGMLAPAHLSAGLARYLATRTYAALSARDAAGRLWVSPLGGAPGLLDAVDAGTLRIHTAPAMGDPLHGLPAGQPVGLLVIEYAARRRLRINRTLVAAGRDGLTVEVEQTYGNCPQHIPPYALMPVPRSETSPASEARHRLTEADRAMIASAESFVLGTTHASRGSDASHRGGPAGFVHVEAGETGDLLAWPDYPGNNLFNSLGNLALDPTAALLVTDFATGEALHLSGTAATVWSEPGRHGPVDTGRAVVFDVEQVVGGAALPVRLAV
jgi:uncharacterized protein